jgi:hypothetical protein
LGLTQTDTQASGDAVYYLHAQARDDVTLLDSEVVTVSAIIDNTAPTEPTGGALGATFTANPANSPNFTWVASTDTNGVFDYEIALGTSPGAIDTVGWTSNGLALTGQHTGLALTDGVTYYPSIRALDQAGNISTTHSNFGSFCADTTAPPTPGALFFLGTANLSNTPQLNWSTSVDACSGLDYYEVSLGTAAGASNVIGWTNVGTALNHQFVVISPELDAGTTYHMNVRAIDLAGLTSTSASSSFTIPGVVNVTGVANDPTPTQTKTWNWACDNAPCEYRHLINTTATHDFDGEAFGATTTDSQLVGDGTYYLHVQARRTAGDFDVSATLNLSVIIDNTPPTNPGAIALADTYTTNATTSPSFTWGASTDTNGVFDYEVGIGTTAGATDTQAFTSDGSDTGASPTGLALIEGQSYYATVRALDEAGNVSGQTNSTAFCYDNSPPPDLGSVNGTTGMQVDRSPNHTWIGSTDACSGTSFYEIAVGTSAGADDISAWANIGNVTAYQVTGLSLTPGTNYYTSVRVTDNAGFTSGVISSAAWSINVVNVTGLANDPAYTASKTWV